MCGACADSNNTRMEKYYGQCKTIAGIEVIDLQKGQMGMWT